MKESEKNIRDMMVRTRVGGVGRAVDWEAAVVAMAKDLLYAISDGDVERARKLIEVIESWRNGNEEERKAYKIFTRTNPYKKLYETAKKFSLHTIL